MKPSKKAIKNMGKEWTKRWLGLVWNTYVRDKHIKNMSFETYILANYDLDNY